MRKSNRCAPSTESRHEATGYLGLEEKALQQRPRPMNQHRSTLEGVLGAYEAHGRVASTRALKVIVEA